MGLIKSFVELVLNTAVNVVPVAAFLLFFYRVVLGQKLANRGNVLTGLALVVLGLALFLQGLETALFPVGRMMVEQLTSMTAATADNVSEPRYYPVYAFAFCIAFGAAVAEPALLAVAHRVNVLSGGAIHSWGLRVAAAVGVATGVTLGCVRIVTGAPLSWYVAGGFAIIAMQSFTAPKQILSLAYDSGAVSTTAVTVPIVTALGLGLAEQVPGRSPLLDGFGLIALACIFPVISVLAYAQLTWLFDKWQMRRRAAHRAKDSFRS